MIVLSPSTPMMIKKKTKATTRKNVAHSSVIMMTHPLCSYSALFTKTSPAISDPPLQQA
jgi:hypothetical protein